MRVFDDSNHPHYGPARRLHVMLMQLFGDTLDSIDKGYIQVYSQAWDATLINFVGQKVLPEGQAQRLVLHRLLDLRPVR